MTSVSLECITKAARWDLEFLQLAGLAADQAVLLQLGAAALCPAPGRMCPSSVSTELCGLCAETVNGSATALLPPSSKLFQLTCFPLGIIVKEAVALWL